MILVSMVTLYLSKTHLIVRVATILMNLKKTRHFTFLITKIRSYNSNNTDFSKSKKNNCLYMVFITMVFTDLIIMTFMNQLFLRNQKRQNKSCRSNEKNSFLS